jgi:protein-S-isoprenylcysteine O-methyltransferase Ste14
MPTNYFLLLLVLLIVFHFALPIVQMDYFPYNYLGIALILFGGGINLWADALMKKSRTTVKPHLKPSSLLTSGPFAFTRHPMYLGMLSILLGAAVIAGSLVSFIFPLLYIVLMELLFIPVEERNLEEAFGDDYRSYKKRVARWLFIPQTGTGSRRSPRRPARL